MAGFHLSAPWGDFTSEEDQAYLRSIEAKQGKGLTGAELHCVFQSYLPAGTTQECCSYLHALYELFRTPQDSWSDEVWDDILWIWLYRSQTELEQLNQFQRIPEELRRIVQGTLIPAEWQPEQGPDVIYRRTRMLMSWMATPWGEVDMPDILDTLSAGGFTQQLLLLRLLQYMMLHFHHLMLLLLPFLLQLLLLLQVLFLILSFLQMLHLLLLLLLFLYLLVLNLVLH
jgi:hypothetical protein